MTITEGWDALQTPQAQTETDEQREIRLQHIKDHVKVFGTEEGKRVLNYYKKFTVDLNCWQPGYPSEYALWRDGQNTIVREIIKTLETKE